MTYPYNFTMNDENNFQRFFPNYWDFSSGDSAKLALVDLAAQTFSQDYSSDAGFTYDSSRAEFAAGQAQQKLQVLASAKIGLNFNSSLDPNWNFTGAATSNLTGTPTLVGGKMRTTGDQGIAIPTQFAQQITMRCKYTPTDISAGEPPENISIMGMDGGVSNSKMGLTHSPSGTPGNFRVWITRSDNTALITAAKIGPDWTPVQGQEYEIALVVDADAGTIDLYVDKVLYGSLPRPGWDFGTDDTFMHFGSSFAYGRAEADFEDCIVYHEKVTSFSNYSVPDFVYLESKVDLPQFSYSGLGSIQQWTNFTGTESNAPRYIVDGKYYTAGSWQVSDGSFAQASTLAEVAANISALITANTLNVSVVFGDGNTQMSVDQTDIEYTGQEYANQPTMWILNVPGQQADGAFDFDCDFDAPAGTTVKFTMVVNGVNYWWNAGVLEIADGTPAQTNTLAEVQAGFTDLGTVLGTGKLLQYRIWATSDGTATPVIRSITSTVDFSFDCYDIRNCTVFFCVKIPDEMPETTAEVRVYFPKPFFHNNNKIVDSTDWKAVDVMGRIDIALIETETVQAQMVLDGTKGATFECRYTDLNGDQQTIILAKNKVIPNQDSAKLEDLVDVA